MILWVDDVRKPECDGLVHWAKNFKSATIFLSENHYRAVYLDYDLGGKNGYDLAKWIVDHETWPYEAIIIHSWNKRGTERMLNLLIHDAPPYLQVNAVRAEAYPT